MEIKEILKQWSNLIGASGGNIPTNIEAFLYGIQSGESNAISEASECVREWACHLDSVHEAHLKGILYEIADAIDANINL